MPLASSLHRLLCLVALLATLGLVRAAPAQETLSAVAVVNDEIITELDMGMRLRLLILSSGLQNDAETQARLKDQVLKGLIDERLQTQEAGRLGITIDNSAVQDAFARIASGNSMEPSQLADALKSAGVLPEYLLDQIRAQLTWQAVVQRTLRPQVDISEEQIDAAVAQIEANRGKPQNRIAEIFLAIDSVSDEATVRQQAQRIYEALLQGVNFSAIARQFSQSGSAPGGGELGWVEAGELPNEVEAALASATPGQILPPVETLNGIYIILVREQRASAESEVTVTLKQLLQPVANVSDGAALEAAAKKLLELSSGIKSCADMDRVAEAHGLQATLDIGTVSLDDLPASARNSVAGLAIGKPSQPTLVPGGIAVFAVCDRTEVGVSREKVRERLLRTELEVLARRYLRDLRRDANIEIRI